MHKSTGDDTHTHDVKYPGLSDHSFVTAELGVSTPIKLYRNVDLGVFKSALENTKYSLAEMTDVNHQMWILFSKNLQNAINEYVPKKTIEICPFTVPAWFNKESRNLFTKQGRLYYRLRASGDPYDQHQHTKPRKETKFAIKKKLHQHPHLQINARRNHQAFLQTSQGHQANQIKLKTNNSTITENPYGCVTLLNNHFYGQFNKEHQLKKSCTTNTYQPPKTDTRGVVKLIQGLKSGKAPGPDGMQKEDLMIDVELAAACLNIIFNKSLEQTTLPEKWKPANITPMRKAGSTNTASNYRTIS